MSKVDFFLMWNHVTFCSFFVHGKYVKLSEDSDFKVKSCHMTIIEDARDFCSRTH